MCLPKTCALSFIISLFIEVQTTRMTCQWEKDIKIVLYSYGRILHNCKKRMNYKGTQWYGWLSQTWWVKGSQTQNCTYCLIFFHMNFMHRQRLLLIAVRILVISGERCWLRTCIRQPSRVSGNVLYLDWYHKNSFSHTLMINALYWMYIILQYL